MIGLIVRFILCTLAVLLIVAGCQTFRHSGNASLPEAKLNTLRIATYNVHYIILSKETGPWSVADWERRKNPLDLAFKDINADVIAFQEMESFEWGGNKVKNLTLEWLLAQNKNYGAAAVGDPVVFPSTQPIMYRKDRVKMLDQGWFFFSETPDVIYSKTFNGSFPAYASWASFKDLQNDEEFRVVNIHTDYASRTNRLRSIELVAERIIPWVAAGESIFVVGDFNARKGNEILETLEDVGVEFVLINGATYHLNRGLNLFGAIDHIGIIGKPKIEGQTIVLRKKFDGEWPTDHYPVIADFNM